MRTRLLFVALGLAVFACGLYAYTRRDALRQWMFDLTCEEQLPGQLRGLLDLASDLTLGGPRLNLEPEVPIAHNGANPFGINTFLQQEVEPAKRERQAKLQ